MYSSSDNVIHAGQKYTISSPSGRGMSVDYKSVFTFSISRTVLKKWAKKSENHEMWANFDPPTDKFFWGAPKILKPVLGSPFQGLLPGKVWTTPPDAKGREKILPLSPIFCGEGPKGYIS